MLAWLSSMGPARFVLQTVLMALTFHCDATEGDSRAVCVITDSMCITRCVSKGCIRHCWGAQRSLALKSMGKIAKNPKTLPGRRPPLI